MRTQFRLYSKSLLTVLCSLVLASFLGCGKEIETSNDDNSVVLRPAADSSKINLRIKTIDQNAGSSEYRTQMSGWAKVPAKPLIYHSFAKIIYSKLSFNYPAQFDGEKTILLTCDYISSRKTQSELNKNPSSEEYNHHFIGCKEDVDLDGVPDELNYIPGDEIAIDKNQLIIFNVHTSDHSDQVEIESDIEVNWR